MIIYCQPLDVSTFASGYVHGVRLITPDTYGVPESADEGKTPSRATTASGDGTVA